MQLEKLEKIEGKIRTSLTKPYMKRKERTGQFVFFANMWEQITKTNINRMVAHTISDHKRTYTEYIQAKKRIKKEMQKYASYDRNYILLSGILQKMKKRNKLYEMKYEKNARYVRICIDALHKSRMYSMPIVAIHDHTEKQVHRMLAHENGMTYMEYMLYTQSCREVKELWQTIRIAKNKRLVRDALYNVRLSKAIQEAKENESEIKMINLIENLVF
ncbi:MAG: hypothetical protein AABY22_19295 [Nanoarchaeota archaeon]